MKEHTATFILEDANLFQDLTLRITATFGPADPDIGPAREGVSIDSLHIVRGKSDIPFSVDLLTQIELERLERYVWEQREGACD